jgi:hypothetical protein
MWFLLEEIKKKRKSSAFKGGEDLSFCGELNFILSLLFLSASVTAPTCEANIISLEPCALNADFQHFIPRSNKFSYFMDTTERMVWGWGRLKDRLTLQIILVFTLTLPKTFTRGCVSVCDKYLHGPHVSVIKFGRVSANDLHLHWIYTPNIWLLTLTRTTLVTTAR